MRIGIDFDNTIACYDGVFHAAALERNLIPENLGRGKNAVRDYLNDLGRRDDYTILQGYVYGARMDLAKVYENFTVFAQNANQAGHALYIVSHKTRLPLMGGPYDMHEAARGFLKTNRLAGEAIHEQNIFFEPSKPEKIARIKTLQLDCFVDDLPEILNLIEGPRKILFDPERNHSKSLFERHENWASIAAALLSR